MSPLVLEEEAGGLNPSRLLSPFLRFSTILCEPLRQTRNGSGRHQRRRRRRKCILLYFLRPSL